jgi:hypothetical protein
MSRPARCIYEHPPSPLFLILICPRLHSPPFITFAVCRLPFVTHVFYYLSCNFIHISICNYCKGVRFGIRMAAGVNATLFFGM